MGNEKGYKKKKFSDFVTFDFRYKKSQYSCFQYNRLEKVVESAFQTVDGLITVCTIGIVDTNFAYQYNLYLITKQQVKYKARKETTQEVV